MLLTFDRIDNRGCIRIARGQFEMVGTALKVAARAVPDRAGDRHRVDPLSKQVPSV